MGIAARIEFGNYLNLIRYDFIKDGEGKSTNDHASETSVYDGIEIGAAKDSRQRVVDTFCELQVQIVALMGVLSLGFGKFWFGVVSEPNDHVRFDFMYSALISSHERPSPGFFLTISNRRSSSCL